MSAYDQGDEAKRLLKTGIARSKFLIAQYRARLLVLRSGLAASSPLAAEALRRHGA